MNNTELLKRGLDFYNINPDNEIIERFNIYTKMLTEWNQKMNLTAITDEEEIIIKHYFDSISCVNTGIITDTQDISVVDVGTGAGFPGLPIKIVNPNIKLTLIDSLKKRTIFLKELSDEMGIDCEIIHGRAEDLGKNKIYREKYDVTVSRAVAGMAVLSEYTLPFVKVGGKMLCLKGPAVFDELKEAEAAIKILGGKFVKASPTDVYKSSLTRYIVIVEKTDNCPIKYPRKAGKVEKSPLR